MILKSANNILKLVNNKTVLSNKTNIQHQQKNSTKNISVRQSQINLLV